MNATPMEMHFNSYSQSVQIIYVLSEKEKARCNNTTTREIIKNNKKKKTTRRTKANNVMNMEACFVFYIYFSTDTAYTKESTCK